MTTTRRHLRAVLKRRPPLREPDTKTLCGACGHRKCMHNRNRPDARKFRLCYCGCKRFGWDK